MTHKILGWEGILREAEDLYKIMMAEGSTLWPPKQFQATSNQLMSKSHSVHQQKQKTSQQKSEVNLQEKNSKYKNGNGNHNHQVNKKKSVHGRTNNNSWKTQLPGEW